MCKRHSWPILCFWEDHVIRLYYFCTTIYPIGFSFRFEILFSKSDNGALKIFHWSSLQGGPDTGKMGAGVSASEAKRENWNGPQVKAGRVWSDAPLDPQKLPHFSFQPRRITFKHHLENRVNETTCIHTHTYAYTWDFILAERVFQIDYRGDECVWVGNKFAFHIFQRKKTLTTWHISATFEQNTRHFI